MKLIWYTVLIRAIPEAIGLTLLCLAVVKEKRSVKDILVTSLICGITAFTMKMLPLKFIIHTLLVVIIEAIVMNIILKIKLQKVFLGILLSIVVLTISEIMTLTFIQYILKLNPEVIHSSAVGTIIAGIPSVLMLYIIAFIINRCNKGNTKETDSYVNQ